MGQMAIQHKPSQLLRCPKCGMPMLLHHTRQETHVDGHSYRIEIYLCLEHGGFRRSPYHDLTPGA